MSDKIRNEDEINFCNHIKESLGDLEDDEYAWEVFDAIKESGIKDIDDFEDKYIGRSSSKQDFIEEVYEDLGQLEEMPRTLRLSIDWDRVWSYDSRLYSVIDMFDDFLFFDCPQ